MPFMPTQVVQALLTEGEAAGGMGIWDLAIQIGLIILIFYLLLIRPQQKRTKEHQKMLDGLKRGDEVITSGGIYGKITAITDFVVTLEVAPEVRIKIQRSQVAGLKPEETPAKDKEKDAGKGKENNAKEKD